MSRTSSYVHYDKIRNVYALNAIIFTKCLTKELINMTASLLKPIVETSCLNAQNVGRYRCIMRYFYEQHQRLRYWLKPQEVHDGVTALGLLEEDYTLDQCQKDLNQLVEWGNLVPRQLCKMKKPTVKMSIRGVLVLVKKNTKKKYRETNTQEKAKKKG